MHLAFSEEMHGMGSSCSACCRPVAAVQLCRQCIHVYRSEYILLHVSLLSNLIRKVGFSKCIIRTYVRVSLKIFYTFQGNYFFLSAKITTKWAKQPLFCSGLEFYLVLDPCENEAILLNKALSSANKHDLNIYVDVYLVRKDCWALFFLRN